MRSYLKNQYNNSNVKIQEGNRIDKSPKYKVECYDNKLDRQAYKQKLKQMEKDSKKTTIQVFGNKIS